MPRNQGKTSTPKRSNAVTSITISGNQNAVATQGGRASVTHIEESIPADFRAWREQMEHKIDSLKNLPKKDKSFLKQNVEQIAGEAEKGPRADVNRIERLVNTISIMAPDIFNVAITTLANPLAGIGLALKKINEKAIAIQKV